MMNEKIQSAIRLIRKGESQQVEFKKKANHPEKIIREVVAFANTDGGHLFIGVDDDGTISGLKHPEDDEYVLSKAIKELCRPAIDFSLEVLRIKEDTEILHYRIPKSNKRPHFAFLEKKHRYGKAFVRDEDHSIQASYEIRQILKRANAIHEPIAFEENTKQLFKYLDDHGHITLKEYMQVSGQNKKNASQKLISLVLSGGLKVVPQAGGDIFLPIE